MIRSSVKLPHHRFGYKSTARFGIHGAEAYPPTACITSPRRSGGYCVTCRVASMQFNFDFSFYYEHRGGRGGLSVWGGEGRH